MISVLFKLSHFSHKVELKLFLVENYKRMPSTNSLFPTRPTISVWSILLCKIGIPGSVFNWRQKRTGAFDITGLSALFVIPFKMYLHCRHPLNSKLNFFFAIFWSSKVREWCKFDSDKLLFHLFKFIEIATLSLWILSRFNSFLRCYKVSNTEVINLFTKCLPSRLTEMYSAYECIQCECQLEFNYCRQ